MGKNKMGKKLHTHVLESGREIKVEVLPSYDIEWVDKYSLDDTDEWDGIEQAMSDWLDELCGCIGVIEGPEDEWPSLVIGEKTPQVQEAFDALTSLGCKITDGEEYIITVNEGELLPSDYDNALGASSDSYWRTFVGDSTYAARPNW